MKKVLFLVFVLCSIPAFSQINGDTARRIQPVSVLPSVCKPLNGDIVYLTTGASGPYRCISTNLWQKIDALNIKDFGALGDGITNDSAALASGCILGTSLVIPSGNYLINDDVTCECNLIFKSGILNIGAGKVLTINGPISAPDDKIFDGSGNADINGVVNVTWFGGIPDGIKDYVAPFKKSAIALRNGGILKIPDFGSANFYKYNNAAGLSAATNINKTVSIKIEGYIKSTGFTHQVDPATIFYINADNVVISGPGTLEGPGNYDSTQADAITKAASLLMVFGSKNCSIRGLRFVNQPQIGLKIYDSPRTSIKYCQFSGGRPLADIIADYAGGAGTVSFFYLTFTNSYYSSVSSSIFSANTTANMTTEGIWAEDNDFLSIIDCDFVDIVDHDVYGGIRADHMHVSGNRSTSTLTPMTEKLGESIKVRGNYANISGNNINNPIGGVSVQIGDYASISNNTISGFSDTGISLGWSTGYIDTVNNFSVNNNMLVGSSTGSSIQGISIRLGVYIPSPRGVYNGKIAGNTIIGAGDSSGISKASIYIVASNGTFADNISISENKIFGSIGEVGMFFDGLRYSKISHNTIENGIPANFKPIYFNNNSLFNEIDENLFIDSQPVPVMLAPITYNFANNCTDNLIRNNIVYGCTVTSNLWGASAVYRNVADHNRQDIRKGYPLSILTSELAVNIINSADVTLSMNIPAKARLIGAQLIVEDGLAAGETWNAVFSGGSTTILSTGNAIAKNTKLNWIAVDEVTTAITNIEILRSSNPGIDAFTAQGKIRALVYYEILTDMVDVP